MKQRITGLVSLHEIPFSSRALQREEGNCPHYTKRGREGGMWGGKGERQRGIAKISPNPSLFFMLPPRCSLHGCRPTCDITFINTGSCFVFFSFLFFSSLFGKVGETGEREEKVTLALKPAIVFPPGQPANQAAQSEREREIG